jgi:hypothetical protein
VHTHSAGRPHEQLAALVMTQSTPPMIQAHLVRKKVGEDRRPF